MTQKHRKTYAQIAHGPSWDLPRSSHGPRGYLKVLPTPSRSPPKPSQGSARLLRSSPPASCMPCGKPAITSQQQPACSHQPLSRASLPSSCLPCAINKQRIASKQSPASSPQLADTSQRWSVGHTTAKGNPNLKYKHTGIQVCKYPRNNDR